MSCHAWVLQKLLHACQLHAPILHMACSVGCGMQAMGSFCAAVAFQDMLGASSSALSSAGPANGSSPGLTGTDAPQMPANEQARPMELDGDATEAEVLQSSPPDR